MSGLTCQDLNRRSFSRSTSAPRGWRLLVSTLRLMLYTGTIALALVALFVLLDHGSTWARASINHVRVLDNSPYVFSMYADVGHSDVAGKPSLLLAVNDQRQVRILEITGNEADDIRVLPAPYLFGANEDQTPVTMRLLDVNQDSANDLIVTIKNEEIIYLNQEGEFALLDPAEHQQLVEQWQQTGGIVQPAEQQ